MNKRKLFIRALLYALKKWWLYIPGILLFILQDLFLTLFLTFTQKLALDAAAAANVAGILRTMVGAVAVYGFGLFVLNLGSGLFDYTSIATGNLIQADIFRSSGSLRQDGKEDSEGDIAAHLLNDSAMTAQLVTHYPGMLLMPLVQFIGCLLVILVLNWQMGLLALVFSSVPILYNRRSIKKVEAVSTQQLKLNGQMLSQLGTNLNTIETIKGYALEDRQTSLLRDTLQSMRTNQLKIAFYQLVQGSFANLSHAGYTIVLLIWGFMMYRNGAMVLSTVLILPTLSSGILKSVESMCKLSFDSEQLYLAANRAFGFLDAHQTEELNNREVFSIPKRSQNVAALELEQITYRYENGHGFMSYLYRFLRIVILVYMVR